MVPTTHVPSPERAAMLAWIAQLGAVTAEALAQRDRTTVAVARGRLLAAVRQRLLSHQRPLTGQPALYTLTRSGARSCGAYDLDPCRVSASNAQHLIECASAAAALERCYPDHQLTGERQLRRDERNSGRPIASALIRFGDHRQPQLHRPDLILWPPDSPDSAPIAVEVELTVKSPQRLLQICTAWARCSCVAGVIYLAAPAVQQPLARAIQRANAGETVLMVPLSALS